MKYNSSPFIPYRGSTFLPSLLLWLFVMNFPSVICTYVWHKCDNSSNYTDGSTYSTNLNGVLNDLFRNALKSSGFNTSSRGQSPSKVYGLLQCTGDISAVRCSNCVVEAETTIDQYCANNIGARIWLDDCFLRYHNSNFISILDTEGIILVNVNHITGNIDAFESTTTGLLSNLSNKAYIPANKRFAAGSANYSALGKLYGLVQCCRDISIQDCRKCLSTARTKVEGSTNQGAQVVYGSCKVRYEIYPFFDSAQSSSPSPEGSTPNKVNGTSSTKSKKRHELSLESGLLMQEQQFVFRLEALAEATENFHDNKKLGEGGFGAVYKGTTRDGNEIAVKRLSAKSLQGKKEFMNEVKLLNNVQHRNLARLLGCCAEGDERLLIYEYFPNKSLDTFIFDSEKSIELDWQKRYNIIIGIARGLLYLHQDSQLRIIHRDIKSK